MTRVSSRGVGASLWHRCLSVAWVPRRGVSATMVVHLVPEPAHSFSRVLHTLSLRSYVAAQACPDGTWETDSSSGTTTASSWTLQAYLSFVAVVRDTIIASVFAEAVITWKTAQQRQVKSRQVYLSRSIWNHGVPLAMSLVIRVARVAITNSSLPGANARAVSRCGMAKNVCDEPSDPTCPSPFFPFVSTVSGAITPSSPVGAAIFDECRVSGYSKIASQVDR